MLVLMIILSTVTWADESESQEAHEAYIDMFTKAGLKGQWVKVGNSSDLCMKGTEGTAVVKFHDIEDDYVKMGLLFNQGDLLSESSCIVSFNLKKPINLNLPMQGKATIKKNSATPLSVNSALNFTRDNKLLVHIAFQEQLNDVNLILTPQIDEDLQEPIVSYSFVISCISVALIFAYSKHSQDCLSSESAGRKTSISFLILQSLIDFAYTIWHAYLSTLYYRAFDYLVLAAFMSFAVYIVVHGRLLKSVWKAQNPSMAQDGLEQFNRRFNSFEGFSFILITSAIPVLIILHKNLLALIVVTHSFLPQIYSSAKHGHKNSIRPSVIIVISSARLSLILYIFLLSEDFTGIERDIRSSLILSGYFLIQLGVVLIQNQHPRFFLPRLCRPKAYSYFRDMSEEKLEEKTECIICMTALNFSGQENTEIINFSRTMHTPCNHKFHEDCLGNWMAVKMECPTCRTPLPFIE